MDLVDDGDSIKAISNKNSQDLSFAIKGYAKKFFDTNKVDMFIGKDRSPSCGVCSARIYDSAKELLSDKGTGLMAQEAKDRAIVCYDAEKFLEDDI